MSAPVAVEISVDSVACAIAAERGGANRIELCSSLAEGGLTPSGGLIETTRETVKLDMHVMIRPRAGDFCYDKHEFDVMQRDIAAAKKMGVKGVVLGILDINGRVDVDRTRKLVESALPLEVTFHRAFDMAADLPQALEDICAIGIGRILTSGGEKTAWDGRETIAQLVRQAPANVTILPGCGIKAENARTLVEFTGVKEIHAGLRSPLDSSMVFRNPRVSMGSAEYLEYQRYGVREEDVRRLCHAVNAPL